MPAGPSTEVGMAASSLACLATAAAAAWLPPSTLHQQQALQSNRLLGLDADRRSRGGLCQANSHMVHDCNGQSHTDERQQFVRQYRLRGHHGHSQTCHARHMKLVGAARCKSIGMQDRSAEGSLPEPLSAALLLGSS
eukprot:2749157-Pleurochrysis_carterae.AAC.1